MKDRYISEKALIENIAKITDLRTLSTKTVGEAINNVPSADIVEVKHGRWQIEDRGGKPTDRPICSQCGATPKYYVNGESSSYCQECGSKMERKVKPYVG